MNVTDVLALIFYAISAALLVVFGVVYLTCSEYMPYHRAALGLDWKDLNPPLQTLLITLLRVAGGGFLASGLGIGIILGFPFRSGEPWATYAILVIGLTVAIPTLYATIVMRRRTPASPPVAAGAVGVGSIVVGFILSLV